MFDSAKLMERVWGSLLKRIPLSSIVAVAIQAHPWTNYEHS